MNKLLCLLLVATIGFAATPFARGLGTPAAPPGIAADHWIAMGDAAGFVITETTNGLSKGLRSAPNVVQGYFMVRPARTWLRVNTDRPRGIYPTKLTQ
jgi:hypothetical protein